MEIKYSTPLVELQYLSLSQMLCTSGGEAIDPSGEGEDFTWGD